MKILLVAINAKYIHSNPAVFSLRASCKAYQSSVEIAEYTINQQPGYILSDIYQRKPDVVAFSCYIWNRRILTELIPDLKQILPDADLWAGGPEVTYDAKETLRELPLRGVMTHAGEGSFSYLVKCYNEGQSASLPAVLSLPPQTLNEIPFWYEDLSGFEHRIIYYESSRGCPFSCSYCLSSIEKCMDFRDKERVTRELQFFLDKQVPQVKFIDRTFNCKKDHALYIWQFILTHDNGVTNFHFEVAADLLDEEMLSVLEQMRPGAVQLEIGVQSTNPATIAEINRKMDFEKVAHIVSRILSWNNIHLHLDLIAGLPFEDLETFCHSFDDVYALHPEQLQLGFLKVLKGSVMYENRQSYGLRYRNQPPYEVLSTNWLSFSEICGLKQVEEMVEIYYNSGQFSHTLTLLEQQYASSYELYRQLADFYNSCGYFDVSASRLKKYELLLDFALSVDPARENRYRESLIYDLYLRENVKNRPAFGMSIDHYHDAINEWLHQEAQTHAALPMLSERNFRQLLTSLHIEVFTHLFDAPQMVVFHYDTRNPLTNNCETYTESLALI